MRLPSVKTIQEGLGVDSQVARGVRRVLEDYSDGLTCNATAALSRVDDLIGGHGVEYLRSRTDTFREARGVEYVNMGDPYRATVMFDLESERFIIGCWGDVVERDSRRFGEEEG